VSKEDPKHGRWILPLVVAGLIGFTYVFVNALPAADIAASTTTTSSTTTTVVQTTTTTTLPSEIRGFLNDVARFETTAQELVTAAQEANDAWENREETGATFDETLAVFEEVAAESRTLADEVAAVTVPDPYVDLWPAAIASSEDMAVTGAAMVQGLRASDDGSARREAVAAYEAAGAAFLASLDAVDQVTP